MMPAWKQGDLGVCRRLQHQLRTLVRAGLKTSDARSRRADQPQTLCRSCCRRVDRGVWANTGPRLSPWRSLRARSKRRLDIAPISRDGASLPFWAVNRSPPVRPWPHKTRPHTGDCWGGAGTYDLPPPIPHTAHQDPARQGGRSGIHGIILQTYSKLTSFARHSMG